MTNTNDFRQYSYQYDTAKLISSFNYTRGSHAPKVRPEYGEETEAKLRVKETKGIKSQAQLIHEQRVSRKKVIQISVAAVLFLAMIGLVLNSFAVKNQLTRKLAQQETAIANAQSENISLQSQLNIMYSVSMIDKYAVGKLGMSKVRQGQVQYIDVEAYKAAAAKAAKNSKGKKVSPAAAAIAAAKVKEKTTEEKDEAAQDEEDLREDSGVEDYEETEGEEEVINE